MSKYGYLEVYKRVPWTSRYRESTIYSSEVNSFYFKTSLVKIANILKLYKSFLLTLSFVQTNTDTFANSVYQDETARNEPSHLDLHCLPFCY